MITHYATPDMMSTLLVIVGAVFVHACYQLSLSVLTLLSSHSIARRLPNTRLLNLSFWYIIGAVIALTALQLAALAFMRALAEHSFLAASALTMATLPLIAILTALIYYRRGAGTRLWLPRSAASYITNRAKKTRSSVEALGLGIVTVVTELPFAIAPVAIVAYVLYRLPAEQWLQLSAAYGVLVAAPLVFTALYISSGHKVSRVQLWREGAKPFLQWTSAFMLFALAIFIAILQLEAEL